jgi:hypothetical protein
MLAQLLDLRVNKACEEFKGYKEFKVPLAKMVKMV